MGAVSPVLPVISSIGSAFSVLDNTIGLVNNLTGRSRNQAQKELRENQRLSQLQAAQNNAFQKEQYALDTQNTENERRDALRRAVARQRAEFGSQGVGSNGGSSEAVLLGLFDESEAERKKREQLDSMRNRALDIDLSQQGATNLLLSTQLAERKNLQRFYLPR